MNWYIGQPIVAIKNDIARRFKKNDEFKIIGLRISPCKCVVEINIGLGQMAQNHVCRHCLKRVLNNTGIAWKSEKSFAPLDQDISELTEILTKKETV